MVVLLYNKSMIIPRSLVTYLKKETNLKISQAIEDADTLIFRTALNVAEQSQKKVIVIGTDVDLATLIIDLTPNDKHIAMWKPNILSKPDVIYEAAKINKLKNMLLFAHAFTGCDTVSSIFNKGKQSLLNLIKKESTVRQEVHKFYEPQSTVDDIKEAGERIMLQLLAAKFAAVEKRE